MAGFDKAARFILTFHGIGEPGAHIGCDEIPYWVSEETFHDIIGFVASGPHPTLPPIEVTFDDGNVSDIEVALPVLVERGLSARFFVLAGRIGARGYLSRSDIQDLSNAGMTIGSHGWAHVDWRRASENELARELIGARAAIADVIGRPLDEVGIPFGSYDRRIINRLISLDYARIYTSDGGFETPPPVIARNSVKSGWNAAVVGTRFRQEQTGMRRALRRARRFVNLRVG